MTKHDVKVYSTPSCPWCHKAKEFLTEKKIPFKDIDVASDAAARNYMIKKSGQMGVPVIEIDGAMIVGFDRPAISKKLGIS